MSKEITLQNLYDWADEIAMKHWGVKYTDVIELTNRRWTSKNAHFMAVRGLEIDVNSIIGFSRKRNAERTIKEVKGTLLHELVHWRLYTQGIPHKDTDKEFVEECLRVGANISKATKAQKAYNRYITNN